MSCESVRERIFAHLDGALESGERMEMMAHVHSCIGCAARLKSAETLRAGLRGLPEPRMPETLAIRLRVMASHERKRHVARASFAARAAA